MINTYSTIDDPVNNLENKKTRSYRANSLVRWGLAAYLPIALVIGTGCRDYTRANNEKPVPIKTSENDLRYAQLEKQIINIVENSVRGSKSSDIIVNETKDYYYEKNIETLVKLLDKGGFVADLQGTLQSSGYLVNLRPPNGSEGRYLEFIYFNHPELKGDIVFSYHEKDNEIGIGIGVEKNVVIGYYSTDGCNVQRGIKNLKTGFESVSQVRQGTLDSHLQLVKEIKKRLNSISKG